MTPPPPRAILGAGNHGAYAPAQEFHSTMKIQLAKYEFTLSDRYREGSILNAAEAKALNVVRGERIRNRVARHLDRAAPNGEILVGDARVELYAYVDRVDSNFEFEARSQTKAKVGTLEMEIEEVARGRAQALARERGRGQDEELVGELFLGLLDDPGVEAEAAARIEARTQVAAEGINTL